MYWVCVNGASAEAAKPENGERIQGHADGTGTPSESVPLGFSVGVPELSVLSKGINTV